MSTGDAASAHRRSQTISPPLRVCFGSSIQSHCHAAVWCRYPPADLVQVYDTLLIILYQSQRPDGSPSKWPLESPGTSLRTSGLMLYTDSSRTSLTFTGMNPAGTHQSTNINSAKQSGNRRKRTAAFSDVRVHCCILDGDFSRSDSPSIRMITTNRIISYHLSHGLMHPPILRTCFS